MYEEHTWIKGVLHVRGNPLGLWRECSAEQTLDYIKDRVRGMITSIEHMDCSLSKEGIVGHLRSLIGE
jgi:hypothetical protein